MPLSIVKGFTFVSNEEDELMKLHEQGRSAAERVASISGPRGGERTSESGPADEERDGAVSVLQMPACCKAYGLSMRKRVLTACSLHLKVPGSKISDRRPTILTEVHRGFS
jgi:hypothetical protein